MANQEGDNTAERRLTFGRYAIDLRRGCLLLDGREIALQPEPFAVLAYLAARPGELVRTDDLVAAVWPDLVVPDDTLEQSVSDLRRALGETGARLIATTADGYRFDPNAVPPDRRKPRHWTLLRWRWIYGILAPLVLLLTLVVLWLSMRGRRL